MQFAATLEKSFTAGGAQKASHAAKVTITGDNP